MTIKIQFETQEERETIIANNSDKFLVEEQQLFEGNFLIFSDIPATQIQMFDRICALELEVSKLVEVPE